MLLGRKRIEYCIDKGLWDVYRNGVKIGSKDLVIGTNSVDVTLGRTFIVTNVGDGHHGIDPYDPSSLKAETVETDDLWLEPGQTILGNTCERFDLKGCIQNFGGNALDIAPMYDGRSTCGRLFLASHITAGYGDAGFSASWTLELKNMSECNALRLHAGMRIGQVSFHLVIGGVGEKYHGAYTDQHDQPKAPVLGRERF